MSATPTAQPTPVDAEALLMREVFAGAFFDKMAALGRVPETEAEAIEYLTLGRKLLAANAHQQVKAAGTRVDFLKEANQRLDGVLQAQFGVQPPNNLEEQYVKNAEAHLGAHPAIQQAAEAYLAAIAGR